MLHKKPKELIFCCGQFQRHAVFIGPSLQQLERDPVGTEFSGSLLEMLASSEDGIDSGHQYRQLERLCNIVVPADVQSHDNTGFRIRCS